MKTARSIIIILSIIVLFPLLGSFMWIIQKETKLDLMIINKTVEKVSKNEMRSLNWVLNYNKIVKSSSDSYNYEKDYFGYHPEPISEDRYIQSFKLKDLSVLKDKYEGFIFLDNQGVRIDGASNPRMDYYGGFNQSDYLLLKEMSDEGKLIIAEYNFFSEPTEDLVRFNTEQFLDVYSVHWKGKFMRNLDKEKISKVLDDKWIGIYSDYTGNDWTFTGSGIVLINEKQSRILVLPADQYMTKEFPSIITNSDLASFYNVKEIIPFTGWFQIVYEGKNDVISRFDLNLNEEGKQIVMNSGLECGSPAAISLANQHQYFFAGDFSKQSVFLGCSKVRMLNNLVHLGCSMRGNSPSQFFHNYYLPMYSAILNEYSTSLEKE